MGIPMDRLLAALPAGSQAHGILAEIQSLQASIDENVEDIRQYNKRIQPLIKDRDDIQFNRGRWHNINQHDKLSELRRIADIVDDMVSQIADAKHAIRGYEARIRKLETEQPQQG